MPASWTGISGERADGSPSSPARRHRPWQWDYAGMHGSEGAESAAMTATNWAGNVQFSPSARAEPGSVAELQDLVASAHLVRVLGSGHSFSPLATTSGLQLSLRRLVSPAEVDSQTRTAWIAGGATYAEAAADLDAAGWAVANMASLPQVTVAGACATATHGSGLANRCLAAAVTEMELVTADGSLVTLGGADIAGAAVALGALGAVTRLRMAVESRFEVAQQVWLDVPLAGAAEDLGEVLALGYSVSLFTSWAVPDVLDQVWVKSRVGLPAPAEDEALLARLGGRPAAQQVHPIAGEDVSATTPQLSLPGVWYERLPHFLPQAAPSGAGAELQSEWLVERADGAAALMRLRALAERLAPAVRVCEVRAVAADNLWLSPAYERDSVALHFTWRPLPSLVAQLIPVVEEALAPFDPRPHWGKLFAAPPHPAHSSDFRQLAASLDPQQCFANDFVKRYVLDAH
jgi:alditol oxidase